jgi:hypothetical protein
MCLDDFSRLRTGSRSLLETAIRAFAKVRKVGALFAAGDHFGTSRSILDTTIWQNRSISNLVTDIHIIVKVFYNVKSRGSSAGDLSLSLLHPYSLRLLC